MDSEDHDELGAEAASGVTSMGSGHQEIPPQAAMMKSLVRQKGIC